MKMREEKGKIIKSRGKREREEKKKEGSKKKEDRRKSNRQKNEEKQNKQREITSMLDSRLPALGTWEDVIARDFLVFRWIRWNVS